MFNPSSHATVYIACGPTDLRKSFHGLSALIHLRFQLDPYSKSLFAFCNKSRRLVKILYWDGSGLCLFTKRLDKGVFQWPQETSQVKELTGRELQWLLQGLSLSQTEAFKDTHPSIIL